MFCRVLQCAAMCCSVLQCVAVCCSVLQCAGVFVSIDEGIFLYNGSLAKQCVEVYCIVLQFVAVCCSVLQRVAWQRVQLTKTVSISKNQELSGCPRQHTAT